MPKSMGKISGLRPELTNTGRLKFLVKCALLLNFAATSVFERYRFLILK